MKYAYSLVFGLVFVSIGLAAAGCNTHKTVIGGGSAAVTSAFVLRHNPGLDWNNPDSPIRGTSAYEYAGILDFVALQDRLSIKRVTVRSSHELPFMQLQFWYQQMAGTLASASGPGKLFVLEPVSGSEIGYTKLAGDAAVIFLQTDTTGLDGSDVEFTIEEVVVSVDGGPEMTVTTGLPKPLTIRYREFPAVDIRAISPRRESVAGTDTVVGEVMLQNNSQTHAVTVRRVDMLHNGLAGCGNFRLRLTSSNNSVAATPHMLGIGFVDFDLAGLSLVLQPGQRAIYQVVADCSQATGPLTLTANSVELAGDNGTEYNPGGPRDFSGWFVDFVTTFVAADAGSLSVTLPVQPAYGFDSTNVHVMTMTVQNTGTTAQTLRGVYGRVVCNTNLGYFYAWVVDQSSGLSPDTQEVAQDQLIRLDVDSVVLNPGDSATFEVRLAVPAGITLTNTTVQFTLEGVSTLTVLNATQLTGPTRLLG